MAPSKPLRACSRSFSRSASSSAISEAVRLLQLGVLAREQLGERHHHLALLPRRVVLHLAVDHVDAAAVGDGGEDLLREEHLIDGRAEDLLRDRDLARMERPRTDTSEEERSAELIFAAERVADVAE